MSKASITVVILTLNEALHIRRCIESISGFADRIVVIDSGSVDGTRKISTDLGADVFENPFINYSAQFNWALDNVEIETQWVMRLDADEYVTPELAAELAHALAALPEDVQGCTLKLRRVFLGRWLRRGGLYPIRLARVWRTGKGRLESRWMDEHVQINGYVSDLNLDFIDHNLNNISWWTEKHNRYASREAVDLLLLEYGAWAASPPSPGLKGQQAGTKRWIKTNLYVRLPAGVRALAYFLYRFIFRLGFLDGYPGTVFHVLQGFWYRFLVDVKVGEVKEHMRRTGHGFEAAIEIVLGVKISN